eukprot:scaffold27254_cov70-Phaeocystis_antarctica.AAC.8
MRPCASAPRSRDPSSRRALHLRGRSAAIVATGDWHRTRNEIAGGRAGLPRCGVLRGQPPDRSACLACRVMRCIAPYRPSPPEVTNHLPQRVQDAWA